MSASPDRVPISPCMTTYEKQGRPTVTTVDVLRMLDQILDTLIEKFKASNERIKALEDRPQIEFRGVWTGTEVYSKGALVLFQGSAWIALTSSHGQRPGTDHIHWQLFAKRGRDGKDGEDLR